MIPLLLGLLTSAYADDARLVVYSTGSADSAVADVQRELGDAATGLQLDPQRLGDALTGPPTVIGGGHTERCKVAAAEAAPMPAERFTVRAAEVQTQVREGAFERALMPARSADTMLPCLTEVASRDVLRDFYLAWASAAARMADSYAVSAPDKVVTYRDEATRAYDAWRRFIPDEHELDRRADAIGTADGRDIAFAVKDKKLLSTSFQVVPRVAALWVDGSPVKPEAVQRLITGRHLVQYQPQAGAPVASLWVQLDANAPATLAIPDLLPDDITRWADDDQLRPQLAALLSILGEDDLYVVTPDAHVWEGAPGAPRDWVRLYHQRPGLAKLHRIGKITTIGGASLAGAGALTMGVTCLVLKAQTEGEDPLKCVKAPVPPLWTVFDAGQKVLLVGLAPLAVGITLDIAARERMSASVNLTPDSVMLGLHVKLGPPGRSAGADVDRATSGGR